MTRKWLLFPLLLLTSRILIAQSPCSLDPKSNLFLTEGATDRVRHPSALGNLPVAVIFVDFSDAPATEDAQALYNSFIPGALEYFESASFGRFNVDPRPTFKWFRMPRSASSYRPQVSFYEHRTYIHDAVTAADPEVDFRGVKALYIIASARAPYEVSPAFVALPGQGVVADGNDLHSAFTSGRDIRNTIPGYGSHVAVHETMHILGLPDLYLLGEPYWDTLEPAGGWDVMSWVATGAHPLAWHLLKLGWIDIEQVDCVSSGITEATLTPLEIAGGKKAVIALINPSKALVVEYRTRNGLDAGRHDEGALVYTVDASVATGRGPVQVVASDADTDSALVSQHGPKYSAVFDLGSGEVSAYRDPSGIEVEVLSRDASGLTVRVSYPRAVRRRAVQH